MTQQVRARVQVEKRLDLRPPPVDLDCKVVPRFGIRWETEPFAGPGGGYQSAAVEANVAAAQPGDACETHAGSSKDQQQGVAAAEQAARPAGGGQLDGSLQQ